MRADQIGFWPLLKNAAEAAETQDQGIPQSGCVFGAEAEGTPGVRFVGGSGIEITRPWQEHEAFTWSTWAYIPPGLTSAAGSLMSCFDPETRHGAELGVAHGASTTSQSNVANVEFGVDWGSEPRWSDLGRPEHSIGVFALAVHAGRLYAGCLSDDGLGRVHEWDGGWRDLLGAGGANCVSALASHEGSLYAGTTRYRTGGSAMQIPDNDEPGGEVLRLEQDGSWSSCGRLPGCDAVAALVTYGGYLYAAATYQQGVWRLGSRGWEPCGSPGRRLLTLGIHEGRLVGGGNDHLDPDEAIELTRQGIVTPQQSEAGGGGVFALTPDLEWEAWGMQPDTTQIYSLTTSHGRLCASTWPNGLVFELGENGEWTSTGRLGSETEVMGLATYNGSLYGGTLPHAQLHRRDRNGWTRVGTVDVTPKVLYRRAAGLALHDGALIVGTLPSGRVHAMRVGDVVTRDVSLAPGWHHLCVTYDAHAVRLYVDGEPAMRKHQPDGTRAPLPDRPLTVGAGSRGPFAGLLRNLRVFSRSLSIAEVEELRHMDDPRIDVEVDGGTREKATRA